MFYRLTEQRLVAHKRVLFRGFFRGYLSNCSRHIKIGVGHGILIIVKIFKI
jgi:hypothetical protein